LAKVQGKLSEINKERIARGKTSLYANDRSRLTPATASTISPVSQQDRLAAYQNARRRKEAPSSPNPSGLSDKELITTFLREKKNKSSSALLAALGKEINRRNAIQKPAPSSLNPSGLSDKELIKAFVREKGNKKSSVMLTALGKEINRRNALQKPKPQTKINPDDQRRLNSLTNRLPNAITNSEREEIKRDIADIEVLNPGIKPQAIAAPPKGNFRQRNARPKPSKPIPKPKDLNSVHKALEKEADDALNCLLG
jgi:hypothetical protein